MKRGLVLSGGGAKGAFQVGCLLRMANEDSRAISGGSYDVFCGVSVGALNAAFLAQYFQLYKGAYALMALWKKLCRKDVWRHNPASFFGSTGLFNTGPLGELIASHISEDQLRKTGHALRLGVVNLTSGEYEVITEHDKDLLKWVRASSSFPIAFPGVEMDDFLYSDGGLVTLTPLRAAIKAGCDHIDVIQTQPAWLMDAPTYTLKHWWQVAARTMEIITHQSWMKDLRRCHDVNEAIKANPDAHPGKRPVSVHVYAPAMSLQFSSLGFKRPEIETMIAMGVETVPQSLGEFLQSRTKTNHAD